LQTCNMATLPGNEKEGGRTKCGSDCIVESPTHQRTSVDSDPVKT